MNIKTIIFIGGLGGMLFSGCVANTPTAEDKTSEQNIVPSIPENPGIPQNPENPEQPAPEPDNTFATLDGIGNYLNYSGNLVGGETAYTVEFFVRFDQVNETAAGQALYSFTDNFGLVSGVVQRIVTGAHSFLGTMNGGGIGGSLTLAANQWYHVAVSFQSNGGFKQQLHVNGVRYVNGGGSQTFLNFSQRFDIGRPISLMWGASAYLKGSIDGLRISRGVRYGAPNVAVPDRKNMVVDATTIAVWNFNETAGDGKYYDAVGQKLLEKK